jgi:hypothetical protein
VLHAGEEWLYLKKQIPQFGDIWFGSAYNEVNTLRLLWRRAHRIGPVQSTALQPSWTPTCKQLVDIGHPLLRF